MRAPEVRGRATSSGVWVAAVLGLACANVKGGHGTSGAAGAGATGGAGPPDGSAAGDDGGDASDAGGAAGIAPPTSCQGKCTDFPTAPFLDVGVTPDAPTMFPGLPVGAVPCITEPEDGALFPYNWLRPRVKFTPSVKGVLHEIRFHSAEEQNDLVAYTLADRWAMPRSIWVALAANVRDEPISLTVRELGAGASTVSFTIAPVPAPGSVVYWAANPADHGSPKPTSSSLQGFAPGDEATITTLAVGDVQMKTRGADNGLRLVTCIGCHSSTPDGASVAFLDNVPWSMAIAGVAQGRTGLLPTYVTSGGTDAVRQPGLGIFSFSRSHWRDGDRVVVAPYFLDQPCGQYMQANMNARLAWFDLEAPAVDIGCPVKEGTHFGILARNGDARGAANPAWSHDGKTIVYSSTTAGVDGRLATGPSDLYTVPYNVGPNGRGLGGDAKPLPGAAEADFEEYYPAFSPDDALVVFDRVPAGASMYANPMAELYVVPASASSAVAATAATRLAANDPPKCSGFASPGVNNHWAKWAPDPEGVIGSSKTYYWLIFSSNRFGTPPVTANDQSLVQVSQLYATAVVVDAASATTTTYPAIYLWNQNVATLNTTPAWDPFKIPVVP